MAQPPSPAATARGSRAEEELAIASLSGVNMSPNWPLTARLIFCRRSTMPTQEAKAHRVGANGQDLRNTSPEIAEAIFESPTTMRNWRSKSGRKAATKCWRWPLPKPIKTACSGANRRLSVKTSRRFSPTWAHPNLLKKPGVLRVFRYFAASLITFFKSLQRAESLVINRTAVKRQSARCGGACRG